MKLARYWLAASVVLLCGLAQGPAGPPDAQAMTQMRVRMLTSQLSLTDSQAAAATEIFTGSAAARRSLESKMEINRQQLQEAIRSNDTAAIESLAAESGSLAGQITAIESKAQASFYGSLTDTQKARYDSTQRGGGGGRGGPGGFGPPRQGGPQGN
jgi:Spy/CpxP family protein refolding chaperone